MFRRGLFGAIVVALVLTAGESRAAPEDCLAAHGGSAPDGQHWYYHLERQSNRKCWFLADNGLRLAHKVTPKHAKPQKPFEPHHKSAQPQAAPVVEPTEAAPAPAANAERPISGESAISWVATNVPVMNTAAAAARVDELARSTAATGQSPMPAGAVPSLSSPAARSSLPATPSPAQVAATSEQPAPEAQPVKAMAGQVSPAEQPASRAMQAVASPAVAGIPAAPGATPRPATRATAQSGHQLATIGGTLSLATFIGLAISRWLVRRRDVLNRPQTAGMGSRWSFATVERSVSVNARRSDRDAAAYRARYAHRSPPGRATPEDHA